MKINSSNTYTFSLQNFYTILTIQSDCDKKSLCSCFEKNIHNTVKRCHYVDENEKEKLQSTVLFFAILSSYLQFNSYPSDYSPLDRFFSVQTSNRIEKFFVL